jgi:hypothetical protein
MGLYGGGNVTYQAPVIPKDDTFSKFLDYQIERDKEEKKRIDDKTEDDKKAADARKTAGATGYTGLRTGIEAQLRQGLIGYGEATQQLRDYATKYDLAPPETDVTQLTDIYTKDLLPGRRKTGIGAAYEEIFGRQATADEQQKAEDRFNQGYYTSNEDLRNSLYKSTEYNDKFNKSYLDNYYDTMFGKQTKDSAGKQTGQRTVKFSSNLLPQMADTVKGRSGVTTPQFGDITGTPAEIEEQQQNIRDTRQYLYSAGLTNLQGEIDKETQTLKNEGQKQLAKVTSQGSIYNSLVGSFNF